MALVRTLLRAGDRLAGVHLHGCRGSDLSNAVKRVAIVCDHDRVAHWDAECHRWLQVRNPQR